MEPLHTFSNGDYLRRDPRFSSFYKYMDYLCTSGTADIPQDLRGDPFTEFYHDRIIASGGYSQYVRTLMVSNQIYGFDHLDPIRKGLFEYFEYLVGSGTLEIPERLKGDPLVEIFHEHVQNIGGYDALMNYWGISK